MRWPLPVLLLGLALSTPARGASSTAAPAIPSGSPLSDAVQAEVPFLPSDEPNRIVVDLAPDGDPPLPLMLSTAAGACVVTPRYAKKLGISVRRDHFGPDRRATRLGRDVPLLVNALSSDTAAKMGWEHGSLGDDFLSEYVVELDVSKRRVRFLDPDRYQVPENVDASDEAVLAIELVANRPFVDISLGGQSFRALIATDLWITALVPGHAAHAAGIDSIALAGMRLVTGVGPAEVEFAEASSLRIGPFEMARVPLMVAPHGVYNLTSSTDPALGYDILSQFMVRIDYPRRRLWLRRRPNVELTYAGVSYAAQRAAGLLVWSEQRGLRVAGIFPDSPAARLGIRPDDVVVPVGGQTAPGFEAATLEVIAHGGAVTVSRRIHGAWVDVPLPSPAGD